jgi:uncharacterized membrane protein YagU involved in acid resistance
MADERKTQDDRDRYPEEGRKGGDVSAVTGAVPAVQPYALNWGLGIAAGFVATVVLTLMIYFVPPMMGMKPIEIPAMLGTMFLPQGGSAALWLGMVVHFMMGIIFTLIYAGVLLGLRTQSTWSTGAWFGGVLWLVAMLMMPVMMSMHPLVQAGKMTNPGVFMLGMGMGWMPAVFALVAHSVYGIIAGWIYQHDVPRRLAQSPDR